eukprot:6137519-Prymnesium_polylepis.1
MAVGVVPAYVLDYAGLLETLHEQEGVAPPEAGARQGTEDGIHPHTWVAAAFANLLTLRVASLSASHLEAAGAQDDMAAMHPGRAREQELGPRPASVPEWLTATLTHHHHPQCECFSLCGAGEATNVFMRLPIVHADRHSPWLPYLRAVYGELPTLPLDLSKFEILWPHLLPTAMSQCHRFHIAPHGDFPLPRCPAAQCKGWLVGEPPTEDEKAAWARGRSFIWPPTVAGRHGPSADDLLPFALFVAVQSTERRPQRDHLEVIRVSRPTFSKNPLPRGCTCV